MRSCVLDILTPVGQAFSGEVGGIYVRVTSGEVGLLAGHTDYLGGVVPCIAKVVDGEGNERVAFCGGGFVTVTGQKMSLTVDEFVFAEDISPEEAKADCDRLSQQMAACDAKKEPERAEYLKSVLTRATLRLRAAEAQ